MNSEQSIILSIPQIRLCMTVLGMDVWDDLPLIKTEEPTEQRLMNAFLDLIGMGRMIPEQDKFRMEPLLQNQLELVGSAQRVYHLYDGDRILAFLYENDSIIVMLSPDWGNPGYCRISNFHDTSPWQVRDEYAASLDFDVNTELREAEMKEAGQYNAEKLAFFLGIPQKPEELE